MRNKLISAGIRFLSVVSALLLAGGASAATLRLNPASIDFGSVNVGQTATVNVFLDASFGIDRLRTLDFDAGGGTLVSGDYTLTRAGCNAVGGAPAGTTLTDGVGCTFSITFTPSSAGTKTATASASDYNAGAWVTMNLTGVGAVAANPVPTLSEWSMIGLALLIIGASIYSRRRLS